MNQYDEKKYEDALAEAARLRAQAEAIEAKEKIRKRLLELIDISRDPYYDQYLKQMMKDLESGKATPGQIAKEADRTYRLYQQRMGETQQERAVVQQMPVNENQEKKKDTVEFKIGAGIFSTLGAIFVLAALVIIGFNLLEGIWQGICLYVAAVAVILISELAVKRFNKTFALIITGIGISSLFVATVVNFLVLENINGIVASVITVGIALFSIFFGRKREATSIRLISVFGCYICFLPMHGFESELNFLIMMGMVFAINLASVLMPNQKNNTIIAGVHMIAHVIFTAIVTGMIFENGLGIMYIAFFAVLSLLLINVIFYMQRYNTPQWISILFSVALGIMTVILLGIVNFDYGINNEVLELTYKFLTETIAVAAAVLFFVLWGNNKCKWIQYYFMAALVVFFNGFTDYNIEATIGTLLIFAVTRLLSLRVKELQILDCILAVLTVLQGIYLVDEWYGLAFMVVAVGSVFTIRRYHVFHEIVLTVYFVIAILERFSTDWTMPASVGILLIIFLLFNHLPCLKEKKQFPYNVVNVSFAGLICLCSGLCDDYWINSVTMIIGAVLILVAFGKRYEMFISKKYLILTGYLIYMIFAAQYDSSIVVSVLLMLVAIGCVAIGFKIKDKLYRIIGLVLAALVCIKIIIFDFSELDTIPKALLFLVVGVIALAISFLYIYLEKKDDNKTDEIIIEKDKQTENNSQIP